jgi:peptide/bleomycin uptake transporter
MWQKAYDQSFFLIPYALLASNYFSGLITLGMLMQIKSTFSRIRNSMAYILDHYAELAEMLAISKRLAEFYAAAKIPLHTIKVQPIAKSNLALESGV